MPEFTDEQMDARLRDAGARWREATPVPTSAPIERDEVDIAPPTPARRPRTWLAALTGAAVVAAAVIIGVALTRGDDGTPQPAGPPDLAGTTWQLSRVDIAGLPHTANLSTKSDASRIGLAFARTGERITFGDGCNASDGPVRIGATRLVLGDVARTAMGCPGAPPSVAAIDRVFVGTVDWTISGSRLTITKSGVGSLTYVPMPVIRPSTDPGELVGIDWSLSGIEHDTSTSGSSTGSSAMAESTIAFDGKGGVRVGSVCGTATARVTIGRGSMTFSGPYHRTPCARGLTSDELDVVKALNEVSVGPATWSIADGTLTITKSTAKGSTKLTFTDQPSSAPSSDANPPATSLLGTSWLLADVNSPTFHQTLDTTTTKLKLTIDAKGVLGVDDGVNFHSPENQQPVGTSSESIFLGHLTSTAAGCVPTGTGAQTCTRSNVVADFFDGTIGWAIHGGHLTLTKGSTTLVYVRA